MDCEQLRKLLDGELEIDRELRDVAGVSEHLRDCPECSRAAQQFEDFKKLEGQFMSQLNDNGGLKDDVLKQIQASEIPHKAGRSRLGLFAKIAALFLLGLLIFAIVTPSLLENQKAANQRTDLAQMYSKATPQPFDKSYSSRGQHAAVRSSFEAGSGYIATPAEVTGKRIESFTKSAQDTLGDTTVSAPIPGASPSPIAQQPTTIKFQIAASDDLNGSTNFVGPDGTDVSFYTNTESPKIPATKRYVRYKIIMNPEQNKDAIPTFQEIEIDPNIVKEVPIPGMNLPNGAKFVDMFFESEGVNPFVDTDEQTTSTFAVDVDTASYTVTRNYLNRGVLPPKEAIRVEEFINYFKHDYKAPKDKDFAAYLDGCPSKFGDGYQLLRVGLKGRKVLLKDRQPAALTFIIDVSGSMDMGSRLELVKQALTMLVNQMNERDTIGIVVYGSNARVLLEPKRVLDKNAILNAINALAPEGSTNAEEGLMFGYKQASQNKMDGINRVILCSDGVANNGVTDADKLVKQVADYTSQGIFLSVIGFGMGNYNDVLMEKLADKGNGNYAYVDNLKEAKRIFTQNLTGTLQVIAKDVKIQVEFNPKTVKKYRLLGYENRHIENKDFRNDKVDAGEIGAGHEVTALYEIKLYDTDEAKNEGKIATVRLRHKKPAEEKATEFEQAFNREIFAKTFEAAPLSLRLDAAVAEYAEILRHSYWARGSSLQNVIPLVQKLNEEFDEREDVKELLELVQKASNIQQTEKTNQ